MYIKVCQTKSNFKNKFEVTVNGHLEYYGGTPWMNLKLPFQLDEHRASILTDTSDRVEMVSSFSENPLSMMQKDLSNLAAFLGGNVQQGYVIAVQDSSGTHVGNFYSTRQGVGVADNRLIIEYGDLMIQGFSKAEGISSHVSLYINNVQIGQIVKPLSVVNNLDIYHLFLLDKYSNLSRILIFFTLYFDRRYYSNAGEIAIAKKTYNVSYTFDKNDDYYNPLWISDNFNLDVVAPEFKLLDEKNRKFEKNKNKVAILAFSMVYLITGFLLGIAILIGAFKEVPLLLCVVFGSILSLTTYMFILWFVKFRIK